MRDIETMGSHSFKNHVKKTYEIDRSGQISNCTNMFNLINSSIVVNIYELCVTGRGIII